MSTPPMSKMTLRMEDVMELPLLRNDAALPSKLNPLSRSSPSAVSGLPGSCGMSVVRSLLSWFYHRRTLAA